MQSIIVEVYVPATSASYDFRLPSTARVGEVVGEMIRILEATQQNLLFDKGPPRACDRERGVLLKTLDTVAEAACRTARGSSSFDIWLFTPKNRPFVDETRRGWRWRVSIEPP